MDNNWKVHQAVFYLRDGALIITEDQDTCKVAWIEGTQPLAERVDDLKRRVIAASLVQN